MILVTFDQIKPNGSMVFFERIQGLFIPHSICIVPHIQKDSRYIKSKKDCIIYRLQKFNHDGHKVFTKFTMAFMIHYHLVLCARAVEYTTCERDDSMLGVRWKKHLTWRIMVLTRG
jgi:hypothetical protein